jgi:hypothetical protein
VLFVRGINFVVLVVALAAFERLLHRLLAGNDSISRSAMLALGYALFLWSSLVWIGVRTDTPDMLAAACFYGAAAFALDRSETWPRAVAVGVLCALMYLAKTGMLPAAVALVVAFTLAARDAAAISRRALAVPVFAVVAATLVVPLSRARHHLTIGESGTLNYAWYVYPTRRAVPNEHWQGEPAGFGTPAHPTRRVFASPDVFEFDGPIRGTYPPWTDPSYWYEGLQPRFSGEAQQRVLASNLSFYATTFLPSVVGVYVAVFCLGGLNESVTRVVRASWPLLAAAGVGLAAYAAGTDLVAANIPTQPSTRFMAPFVTVALTAMLGAVRLPDRQTGAVAARLAMVTAVTLAATAAIQSMRSVAVASAVPSSWVVAERLHASGLAAGERVAILGRKYDRDCDHEFWARLGRFRIVSQVPNDEIALQLPPSRWGDLCSVLAATGARALVYKARQSQRLSAEWTPLADGYYAYRLPPRSTGE